MAMPISIQAHHQHPDTTTSSSNQSSSTKPSSKPIIISEPCYDKELPPTPTSSSNLNPSNSPPMTNPSPHLAHGSNTHSPPTPAAASSTSSSSSSSCSPSPLPAGLTTPDNSTLQLASSMPLDIEVVTSRTTPGPSEPQSMPGIDAYQIGSSSDRDKNVAKRVTLMSSTSTSGPGHPQYQPQEQHIPMLTHEYRPNGQSALILSQDNTPSSSRITTSSVTTRTSSTPESFNGAHPHDRNVTTTTASIVPGALNINTIDSTNTNTNTHSYSYDNHAPVQSNGHASSSTSSAPPPLPQNPDPSTPNDGSEDPSRVKPRRVLGNYHMSKTLGAGSMGKVKLGVHSRTRDKVKCLFL